MYWIEDPMPNIIDECFYGLKEHGFVLIEHTKTFGYVWKKGDQIFLLNDETITHCLSLYPRKFDIDLVALFS